MGARPRIGAPGNPSAVSAVSAMIRVICAASTPGAWGRASHYPLVVSSSPTRPTSDFTRSFGRAVDQIVARRR